jgi:predicted NUDIX family NTP pyrophosphohydrolase
MAQFPEADRASWFTPAEALRKIVKGQAAIVSALLAKLAIKSDTPS